MTPFFLRKPLFGLLLYWDITARNSNCSFRGLSPTGFLAGIRAAENIIHSSVNSS